MICLKNYMSTSISQDPNNLNNQINFIILHFQKFDLPNKVYGLDYSYDDHIICNDCIKKTFNINSLNDINCNICGIKHLLNNISYNELKTNLSKDIRKKKKNPCCFII